MDLRAKVGERGSANHFAPDTGKNPEQMAECNLEKAKMFEKDRLQVLRDQYFQKIISSFFFGTAGTLLNDKDRF